MSLTRSSVSSPSAAGLDVRLREEPHRVKSRPILLLTVTRRGRAALSEFPGGDWLRTVIDTCDYFRVTLRIVPEALLFGNLKDLQFLYHADPLKLPEVVILPTLPLPKSTAFSRRSSP